MFGAAGILSVHNEFIHVGKKALIQHPCCETGNVMVFYSQASFSVCCCVSFLVELLL